MDGENPGRVTGPLTRRRMRQKRSDLPAPFTSRARAGACLLLLSAGLAASGCRRMGNRLPAGLSSTGPLRGGTGRGAPD